MSNVKVKDAHLEGFQGPFFPQPLERIQKRYKYESVRWHHFFLEEVADRLHSGKVLPHPTTSDGYCWIMGVSFLLKGVRYKVLFPMAHDTIERIGGTNADRHVALYTSKKVSDNDIHYAAAMFSQDLVATYRHSYGQAIKDGKARAISV